MKCLESLALGLALGLAIGTLVTLTLVLLVRTYEKTVKSSTSNMFGYSNKEEWEFIKDPETGRVVGVRVYRKAKYS